MLSEATLDYGERITTALLGVDALYRVESGDEEGLVVVHMAADAHQPDDFVDYADARERFARLQVAAASLPEADRRRYYSQLCASTLAFIRWRTDGLPFTEQLRRFLHVPALPAADDELDALRGEMRAMLNGMGYDGDLRTQCSAWEEQNRVPPDEVKGVLEALLDEAWDRTEERMHIPADKSDGMKVNTLTGMAFNARCDYLNRTIDLNIDPILTRSGLKHLAVHEGYPGHYVQFKLRETWYREGKAPADGLLSVVNTASSSPFEGIADNGLHVIDWIETDDDRFQVLMNQYRAGIGTGAAWRLHALGWPEDRVRNWLREQNLMGGEGWVANRMRFLGAPERSVLIWSYWWGEASVHPVWERVPEERRKDFLIYLYGRMHSPRTIEMFP